MWLTLDKYNELQLKPTNVFGKAQVLCLNAHKVHGRVKCIVSPDGNLGIAFGQDEDGRLLAPWSAPYLAMHNAQCTMHNAQCTMHNEEFGAYVRRFIGDKPFRLVFPPEIPGHTPEAAFMKGFVCPGDHIITDTSFYIVLKDSAGESTWNKSARRNLRRALSADLSFERSDADTCYNLIAAHHQALGYRMAMTLDEVKATARIIRVDFWIVRNNEQVLAAMYCYRVRHDTVQVISSGDTLQGRSVGASMFMERSIIDHYRTTLVEKEGITEAILDHGPTSVHGVQNTGLADFKSSFGCIMVPKYIVVDAE